MPRDIVAIDQSVIASMRARRPDLLTRLLKVYLKHTPGMVQELRCQLDRSDMAGLRFSAHTIKSSSANVGARHLSALCHQLEAVALAPEATIASCAPLAIAIVYEFDRVQTALEHQLPSP